MAISCTMLPFSIYCKGLGHHVTIFYLLRRCGRRLATWRDFPTPWWTARRASCGIERTSSSTERRVRGYPRFDLRVVVVVSWLPASMIAPFLVVLACLFLCLAPCNTANTAWVGAHRDSKAEASALKLAMFTSVYLVCAVRRAVQAHTHVEPHPHADAFGEEDGTAVEPGATTRAHVGSHV